MGQQNDPTANPRSSDWYEGGASAPDEIALGRLNTVRSKAAEDTAVAIARELNGPLTALLLYMGEIKHHSELLAGASSDRAYLQRVVENALLQTERICNLIKQLGDPCKRGQPMLEEIEFTGGSTLPPKRAEADETAASPVHKLLTRREREVLRLISEGYSNKQGALQMKISPRTFESHRAEAMRKLGARNTADLVRVALLHSNNGTVR